MNEVSLSDIADHSCISPVHQSYSLRKSSQDLSSQISQSPASFLSFPGTKHTRPAVQAWSSASRTSEHWSSHCCQGTWSLATKSTVCTSEIFWAWKHSLNGRQWWPLSHFVTAFNTSSFSAWLSGSESSLGLWHSSYPMVQSISRVLQKWSSSGSSDNVAKVARSRSVEHLSFHLLSPLAQMSFMLFHTICVWVLFFLLCLSFVFLVQALLQIRANTTACSLRLAPKSTNTETTVLHVWDYQTGGIERSRVPLSNGGHTQEIHGDTYYWCGHSKGNMGNTDHRP